MNDNKSVLDNNTSFKDFVNAKMTEGNLMRLSAFKRNYPQKYEQYSNKFNKAYDRILSYRNKGVGSYEERTLSPENICKQADM